MKAGRHIVEFVPNGIQGCVQTSFLCNAQAQILRPEIGREDLNTQPQRVLSAFISVILQGEVTQPGRPFISWRRRPRHRDSIAANKRGQAIRREIMRADGCNNR